MPDINEASSLKNKYPSGSQFGNKQAKNPPNEEALGAPIAKGQKKKKGFFKKLFGAFVGEEVDSVGAYVIQDVLIPAARNTIYDAVASGMEMLLFGQVRARNKQNSLTTGARFNYNGISTGGVRPQASSIVRRTHDFDEIVIPDIDENGNRTGKQIAEDVLGRMVDYLEEYGSITVAQFYYLLDIPATPQDSKWGWTTLKNAYVKRVRDGYVISLPKTEPLPL